jgi:uncharacterized protein YbjT (DUF2867 family)
VRILVTGATGYIGGRLVPRLLERGHEVRCFARSAQRLRGRFEGPVEIVEGDVGDFAAAAAALDGCAAAYYLVHSMGSTAAFADVDRHGAATFGSAAKQTGLERIVYLGGLGSERDELSPHLRSRQEVGNVLRESGVPIVEFRAAMIIGSGSISFEMMRYLTERLPVMIAPRWVTTKCQPIGITDVLAYLVAALELPPRNGTYDIGGADVMTYREMMLAYAAIRGLERRIVVVPFFTPRLSSYWVHLITPIPSRLAQPLILGIGNEVVVRDRAATTDFPQIAPIGFSQAVRLALNRFQSDGIKTTWFDAFNGRTPPRDFAGGDEGMLIDRRVRRTRARPEHIAAVFSTLGGERGWLAGNLLWRLRGSLDRIAGGVGLRRGRRSRLQLRVGDAVDFWRVEAFEPGRMLRLRAEMKLPGRAWLEFDTKSDGARGTIFSQTAFFEPRGVSGYAYWYAVAIFHAAIFARMAREIVRVAERLGESDAPAAKLPDRAD